MAEASRPKKFLATGIAHGSFILASDEVTNGPGPKNLAQLVLDKVPIEKKKLTLTHEDLNVHYVTTGKGDQWPLGLTYYAVTKNSAERKACFLFLFKLEKLFEEKYLAKLSPNDTVETLLDNAELTRNLNDLTQVAESGDDDPAGMAKKEIDQVKNIMVENVERLLERGERINLLVSKTERMNHNAAAFRRRTVHLRRNMWWQNVKFSALFILIGILSIYLLFAFVCGLFMEHCL